MDILSLLFPRRCLKCRQIGSYLCPHCVNALQPLQEWRCPWCRKPSLYGQTHLKCKQSCSLDGLMSCFPYSGLMMQAITKFKYTFIKDLSQTLVELMISNMTHPLLFKHPWVLAPIPLHRSRLRWRGFNQAEILAKGLADNFAWPLDTRLLVRERNTSPQMKLSGAKRRKNLAGSFRVTINQIPESILLIDDVATTGSTLNECALMVKQAGAKEVWGLTLAQAIPR